MKLKKSLIS